MGCNNNDDNKDLFRILSVQFELYGSKNNHFNSILSTISTTENIFLMHSWYNMVNLKNEI